MGHCNHRREGDIDSAAPRKQAILNRRVDEATSRLEVVNIRRETLPIEPVVLLESLQG